LTVNLKWIEFSGTTNPPMILEEGL
jgi:hypothetical protein